MGKGQECSCRAAASQTISKSMEGPRLSAPASRAERSCADASQKSFGFFWHWMTYLQAQSSQNSLEKRSLLRLANLTQL